jgi:hypothetical protein
MPRKMKTDPTKHASPRQPVVLPIKPDRPLAERHREVAKRLATKKPALPSAR